MPDWNPLLGTDWDPLLRQVFDKPYWANLQRFVAAERSRYSVYPPREEVFTALRLTPYAETKVVILGQDPYHGEGQAHGLAFSVHQGVRVPPSLMNIYRELREDLGVPIPDQGNLEPWARRGVLLLNTTLTVRAGAPHSHRHEGWETVTNEVIRVIAAKTVPVVFILLGKEAQRKGALIDGSMASSEPPRKGSHTAYTAISDCRLFSRISDCTQLAPARHVTQVGESRRTRRTFPASALNPFRSCDTFSNEVTLTSAGETSVLPPAVEAPSEVHAEATTKRARRITRSRWADVPSGVALPVTARPHPDRAVCSFDRGSGGGARHCPSPGAEPPIPTPARAAGRRPTQKR